MERSNTNWNLYKTFVTVYEVRNMHKVSGILGATRSAISQNIKTLGDQLGMKLFTPHSKGVEPTSGAINIYPQIKSAVELIISAENSASKFREKSKAIIKMALSSTSAEVLVKDYLQEFCTKHPEIKLEISKLEGMDLLRQKQQDFIITTRHHIHQSFRVINLYTTTLAFFAAKDFLKKHELQGTMSKNQLSKLPIIVRKGGRAEKICKEICGEEIAFLPEDVSMVYSMAKNSIGVGFLSKESLKMFSEKDNWDLVLLDVENVNIQPITYVCGYDEHLTKTARTFVDGFSKFCKNRFPQRKTG